MSEATRARGDQTAKTADEADGQRARLVEQIRLYTETERPAYKALGQLVEAVLGRAVKHWDPLARVIHRAKDPASFAEKAIRKKLVDPIQQMNDLCGARVVVRSDAVVEQVCRFIEAHFEVDERSDWLEGMDPDQFGYRSIHYIVRLPAAFGSPDRDPKLAPEDAGHLAKARAGDRVRRAEIQVRTHLQNVRRGRRPRSPLQDALQSAQGPAARGVPAGGDPRGSGPPVRYLDGEHRRLRDGPRRSPPSRGTRARTRHPPTAARHRR